MKRLMILFLAILATATLASCGKTDAPSETSASSSTSSFEESSVPASSEAESSLPSEPPESSETAVSSETSSEESASSETPESKPVKDPSKPAEDPSKPAKEPSKPAKEPSKPAVESKPVTPPPATDLDALNKVTSADAYDAIDAAFAEKYPKIGGVISAMPMDIDTSYLCDMTGLTADQLVSVKGQAAGLMNNCDMLIVVEAADKQYDAVKKAMDALLASRITQFEWYGVMGNGERCKSAKVVSNGNFIALLMVGILPEKSEGAVDFTSDVKLAETTFTDTVS